MCERIESIRKHQGSKEGKGEFGGRRAVQGVQYGRRRASERTSEEGGKTGKDRLERKAGKRQ